MRGGGSGENEHNARRHAGAYANFRKPRRNGRPSQAEYAAEKAAGIALAERAFLAQQGWLSPEEAAKAEADYAEALGPLPEGVAHLRWWDLPKDLRALIGAGIGADYDD